MAKREADCLSGGVGGAVEEGDSVPGAGYVGVDGDTGVEDVLPYSCGVGVYRVLSKADEGYRGWRREGWEQSSCTQEGK